MATVGDQLRGERERRGLQRVDVARATQIYIHHLAALEHGNLDELPDQGIVQGYVRAYAEYLELDPGAVVAEFLKERGIEEVEPEPPEPESVSEPERDTAPEPAREVFPEPTGEGLLGPVSLFRAGRGGAGRRGIAWVVMPIVLVLAVVAIWWLTRERPAPVVEREPEQPEQAARVEPEPKPVPVPPPVESSAPAEPVETPPPVVVTRLRIDEHGVGTGIVNRRLVGQSERFAAGSKVYFWTRVIGGRAGDRIRHVWLHEGIAVQTIELRIGGPHWRTHSFKTPYETGRWAVEARDDADNLLARNTFTCVR